MKKKGAMDEGNHYTQAGDERRLEIIRTAYLQIAKNGIGGLRIREVAEAVGINNATLHYYFPTKEDLIKTVVDYLGHLFMETHSPDMMVDETSTPREKLKQYFVDLEYQINISPERFIVMDELFLQALRESNIQHFFDAQQNWLNHLKPLIQAGINTGDFKPNIDAEQVALVIVTFCLGLPLLGNIQPEKMIQAIRQFEKSLDIMMS